MDLAVEGVGARLGKSVRRALAWPQDAGVEASIACRGGMTARAVVGPGDGVADVHGARAGGVLEIDDRHARVGRRVRGESLPLGMCRYSRPSPRYGPGASGAVAAITEMTAMTAQLDRRTGRRGWARLRIRDQGPFWRFAPGARLSGPRRRLQTRTHFDRHPGLDSDIPVARTHGHPMACGLRVPRAGEHLATRVE